MATMAGVPPGERAGTIVVLVAIVCLYGGPSVAQVGRARLEGTRLVDALGDLQARGLRIVFSSEVVTAEMRVASEPRAQDPRRRLDELLRPHGLKAEDGPGVVIQVVRAPPEKPAPRKRSADPVAGPASTTGPGGYVERLTVTAPSSSPDRGVPSSVVLQRDDLQSLRGVLTDDPLRTAQSLPSVAAAGDFRSEFSVRGSPYRHVGVVIDGVATPWLRHAAHGRRDAGSVSMFNSDVLEDATLLAGAYPQRYDGRLGAQLALTLRQGSRTATHVSGSVSGTNAAVVAEGPIGRSQRGSWLLAARQSFVDWPIRRNNDPNGTVFGFADVQSKLVYDVRPDQQLSVTILGGRSGVDGADVARPADLADGANRAAALSLAWRSTVGEGLVIGQQAHVVAHAFRNKHQTGQDAIRGGNGELSYRVDALQSLFGGVLEAGGQVQRIRGSRSTPVYGEPTSGGQLAQHSIDAFDGSTWRRSGYVNFAWAATPRVTITPGLRVTGSTLAGRRTLSRWVLGEWTLRSQLLLSASAGVSYQHPDLAYVLETGGARDVRPERAAHADLGLSQRLRSGLRWQVSIFNRDERDVLRAPGAGFPIAGAPIVAEPDRFENSLTGSARGIELLVERRSSAGLSGWIAYSYGKGRHADPERGETFWSDFDQRHAVNMSARYAVSDRASVALTFRAGSNFPIPGYLTLRDDGLYAGGRRNEVRLPRYARLDVRAQRSFTWGVRRLTLFAEVLNVLDRTNVGLADGFFRPDTGKAVGFTEALFPRLPSAGVRIDF